MSRSSDRFRPPYGRRLIESPRQCVFAGTVNHHDYLKDDSGGRRFWPVQCGRIDVGRLDLHSLSNYTIAISSILYFQRKITGAALISSKY
jgi:hypothetical protein